MKHSCANVFCSRSGARSGPVKNGDRDAMRQHALAAHDAGAVLRRRRTRPAMYDGAVFEPLLSGVVGAGAGVRGLNGAGLKPSERAGDDVARRVVAGPAAFGRGPRLVVPRRRSCRCASRPTR